MQILHISCQIRALIQMSVEGRQCRNIDIIICWLLLGSSQWQPQLCISWCYISNTNAGTLQSVLTSYHDG